MPRRDCSFNHWCVANCLWRLLDRNNLKRVPGDRPQVLGSKSFSSRRGTTQILWGANDRRCLENGARKYRALIDLGSKMTSIEFYSWLFIFLLTHLFVWSFKTAIFPAETQPRTILIKYLAHPFSSFYKIIIFQNLQTSFFHGTLQDSIFFQPCDIKYWTQIYIDNFFFENS